MKNDGPQQVTLIEVGPRDGFQFETQALPTDLKATWWPVWSGPV